MIAALLLCMLLDYQCSVCADFIDQLSQAEAVAYITSGQSSLQEKQQRDARLRALQADERLGLGAATEEPASEQPEIINEEGQDERIALLQQEQRWEEERAYEEAQEENISKIESLLVQDAREQLQKTKLSKVIQDLFLSVYKKFLEDQTIQSVLSFYKAKIAHKFILLAIQYIILQTESNKKNLDPAGLESLLLQYFDKEYADSMKKTSSALSSRSISIKK